MSRPQYEVKQTYTGTGSLASYTFDFKITNKEQILIVVIDNTGVEVERVRGTDTTFLTSVTFDAVDGGGTVLLASNLPAGYRIALILADDNPKQEFEFRNKTSFTLRTFENALDAIAGAVQSLALRTKQAFKINDFDDETTFNTQLPPNITTDGAGRVIAIKEDGTGVEYGPLITEIDAAQAASVAAIAARDEAEDFAETAEEGAEEASMLLFDGDFNISTADSPFTLDNTHNNKIIFVNAATGDVVINLNTIPTYADGFKVQFIRQDDSANLVRIIPTGGETIDALPEYQLPEGLTIIVSADPDLVTNWKKRLIGIVNSGASLPTGTTAGQYLEFDGADGIWQDGVFSGFSARYGATLNLSSLRAALLYIFQFSYLGPLVSLTASGSGTVREKGNAVTSSTLTAAVTKRSDPIGRIQFFLNGVSVYDENPALNPNSGSTVHSWTGSFADNATFRVDVTDNGATGGPTTVNSSVSFTFVYPYYSGAGAPGRTAAQVGAMTKDIRVSTASLNKAFTTSNGDVYYFAYPASYGALTSIKDVNNFETIGDWTLRTENITGLDGNPVSYRIYEFNNPVVAGSTSYTFIR